MKIDLSDSDVITASEAAELCDVNTRVIYDAVKRGQLSATKFHRSLLLNKQEVLQFRDEFKFNPPYGWTVMDVARKIGLTRQRVWNVIRHNRIEPIGKYQTRGSNAANVYHEDDIFRLFGNLRKLDE